MKLFLREHRFHIIFQSFLIFFVLFIIWLSGFRKYNIIFYCLFLYFFFFICYLIFNYRTRRKMYQRLSKPLTAIEDSLNRLDETPLSAAVSELLRSLYRLFQAQSLSLQKKQEEHLVFIDRWIHQMKTPLSILELIAQELDEPESSNLREEIDRLKIGLSTVLYMSKLRTIEDDFQIKRVHLPSLFEEVHKDNRRLFIRKGVYPKIVSCKNVIVETDEKWLFFIMNQLISNAVKYSAGKAKEILFYIDERDKKVIFKVQDFGVGIPTTDIKRIFDPFYTGENGRVFKESTGVGLYITKEVISYLGHDIEVESKVGRGTTFTIIF